jgi:hypothetical protein
MNTQHIPVRGSTPDEAKGMARTEIGAGSYLSLRSNGAIGRVQTETFRLNQCPNGVAAQALPACHFASETPLGPQRLDYAWDAH